MADSEDGHGTPVDPTNRSPDGLPPLREVIEEHGLRAKKSLGQNFILDLNLTRRIARLAGETAAEALQVAGPDAPLDGLTVIEVGPGPGGLTRALLIEGARRVIAVERDERFLPALEAIAQRHPGRLEVVAEDALAVDWTKLVAGEPRERVHIAANLPYGIATRLLVGWLETRPWPPWFGGMTLMFQKEVAERIVAAPDSKAYGRLAVISQWRAECRIGMVLPAAAFTPPPKVASAVVQIVPRLECLPACDVRTLGRVTAAAFGQRRKMLRSSLKAVSAEPEQLLQGLGLSPEARGEKLTVAEFAAIAVELDRSSAT